LKLRRKRFNSLFLSQTGLPFTSAPPWPICRWWRYKIQCLREENSCYDFNAEANSRFVVTNTLHRHHELPVMSCQWKPPPNNLPAKTKHFYCSLELLLTQIPNNKIWIW